jgi:predicted amidophosphoribosyltransferase
LVLLALTSIPTAFLWWRGRRPTAVGHCRKCGYNLTGNISGVCPECGEPSRSGTGEAGPRSDTEKHA